MTQHPDEPTNTEASVLVELLARCEPFERAFRDLPLGENGHHRVHCMLSLEGGSIAMLGVRDFRRLAEFAATIRAKIAQAASPADRAG